MTADTEAVEYEAARRSPASRPTTDTPAAPECPDYLSSASR
jgi:hypothetical protein